MTKATIMLFILGLFSCGSYKHQAQLDKYAYFQITGELNGEKLVLDNGTPVAVEDEYESFDLNGRQATRIRVNQGKHRVTIYREDKVIVDRVFYVSSGNVFELELP